MLQLMQVRNVKKEHKLDVPVIPTETSQYYISDISGLGPVKANINHRSYAHQNGAGYVSSRTDIRNVIIRIKYRQVANGKTVQTLRRELYSIFPTNKEVNLRFVSDDFVPVTMVGRVESHEPVIWSAEPEVQIVVLGLQPFLEGQNQISIPLEKIPGSPNQSSQYMPIKNIGDIETGMLYGFFISPSAPDLALTTNILFDNLYPDGGRSVVVITSERLQAVTGQKLKAGDTLYLESRPGHRGLSLVRNGLWYNVIGAIQNASNAVETQWSTLVPGIEGNNLINYSITGGTLAWLYSSAAATYTPLYEGI